MMTTTDLSDDCDYSDSSPQPVDVLDEDNLKPVALFGIEDDDDTEGGEEAGVDEIDPYFAIRLMSHLRDDYHRKEPFLTDISIELSSTTTSGGGLEEEGEKQSMPGKTYQFHKSILTSCSEYFYDLLKETPSIDFHKIPFEEIIEAPAIFDLLAESFYSGNVVLANVRTANPLLKASYLLKVKHVEIQCTTYLTKHLNIDNCLDIWLASKFSRQEQLKALATAMIGRHLDVVSKYRTFLELDLETLLALLDDDGLQIPTEKLVYEAAMGWIKHDLIHRPRNLSDVLKVIRFQYLNRNYLATVVGEEELILSNHDAMHTFSQALQYKLGTPNRKLVVKARRDHFNNFVVGTREKIAKEQQIALAKQRSLGKNAWESWIDVHIAFPFEFFQKKIWQRYITDPVQKLILGPPLTHTKRSIMPVNEGENPAGDDQRRNEEYEENLPIVTKIGLFERCIVRPLANAPCIPGDSDDDDFEEDQDDDGVGYGTPSVEIYDDKDKARLNESVWTKISPEKNPAPSRYEEEKDGGGDGVEESKI